MAWSGAREGTATSIGMPRASASSIPSPSMSREQTILKRPVPTSGSGTTGSPRISSHPRRSASNGFMRTSAAGKGQFVLCWSIALEIASRFFGSAPLTAENSSRGRPLPGLGSGFRR